MAKMTYQQIDIAIANADLTDNQIDKLINKLQSRKTNQSSVVFVEKQIQDLEQQKQELEQQVRDLSSQVSWMNTYHAGGVQHIIERGKQAELLVNQLAQAIYDYYDEAITKSKEYYEIVLENFIDIKARFEENPNPNNGLSIMYLNVAIDAMNIASTVYSRYWINEIAVLKLEGKDILTNPKKSLAQAGGLMELRALSSIVHGFIGHTYIYSKNPIMMCVIIIGLLNNGVTVPQGYYEGLGENWIAENLPEAPVNLAKLIEGMEHAQRFVASGLLQKDYLAKMDLGEYPFVSERSLRKYIGWRNAILEWSQKPIPSMFENMREKTA